LPINNASLGKFALLGRIIFYCFH